MRFYNDRLHLHEDKFAEIHHCFQRRKDNVSIVQISFANRAPKVKEYWKIAVKTLQNINIGEELYIDYGFQYSILKLCTY